MNRHEKVNLLILTLSLCLFFVFTLPVAAAPVKVGYYRIEDYAFTADGNGISGYSYELLQDISRYNGQEYEFIYGTIAECMENLATGKVDIVASIPKEAVKKTDYVFSTYAFSTINGVMAVNPEYQDLYYEDFSQFNDMDLGYVKNSILPQYMRNYSLRYGFKTNYKEYDTVNAMLQDLQVGYIDGVLLSSRHDLRQNRIVARLQPILTFFVAPKQNEHLLDEIDVAYSKVLAENPLYNRSLQDKYYSEVAARDILFSREETNYIHDHPVIRVAYHDVKNILAFADKTTGSVQGIAVDMLDQVSTATGLRFEFVKVKNEEYYKAIQADKAEMLAAVEQENTRKVLYDVVSSDSYAKLPLAFLTEPGKMPNNYFTVATVYNRIGTENRIRKKYPYSVIKHYETAEAALAAIEKKEVDFFVDNTYVLQRLLLETRDNRKHIIPVDNQGLSFSFAIAQDDPMLLRIINKALASISVEERDKILANTIAKTPHALNFGFVLSSYIYEIIVLVFTVLLLFALYYLMMERKKERELEYIAFYDKITGEANFDKFVLDAERLIKNDKYVVVMFDINNFHGIIALFGHNGIRRLLQKMCAELHKALGQKELLAHGGNDYFACLLYDADDDILIERLKTIQTELELMCERERFFCKLSLVFGIYRPTQEKLDIERMMDLADLSRMKAKEEKKPIAFYKKIYQEALLQAAEIEAKMESALQKKEFFVVYQPQYALKSGNISGAEALVRWKDGDKVRAPSEFIGIFERNGFIIKLDMYVFEEVCRQLRAWLDEGIQVLPVSVNLSRLHLFSSNLVEDYEVLLKKYAIPPYLLELELTEEIPLNAEDYVEILHKLAKTGMRLAIDDFGSGYSSLNVLHTMPFNTLKLDRMFFLDKLREEKGIHIVEAIVLMAHRLGMVVVAEGVETEKQIRFLQAIGCDLAQGYYYSKPILVESYKQLLVEQKNRE
ncbi:MAG TPA: EAL domain-containing protein [Candidatus Avacidaminococcus intestinavium]|uniref:EAL domain-containing protein n=1 Tax=Candidatus Avacidaminococcus intestinavium TaxID=2840684 RepID=A0A9D1MQW6_9FIRM|nr:EAL domain-containing protein [Candidatus Avacidaminococcus intestinavium]